MSSPISNAHRVADRYLRARNQRITSSQSSNAQRVVDLATNTYRLRLLQGTLDDIAHQFKRDIDRAMTTDRPSVPRSSVRGGKTRKRRAKKNGKYTVTKYTRDQAKKLGVRVKRSNDPAKKIDVFKRGKKVASVGAIGYDDYPTFIKKNGKKIADGHRRSYKRRHDKYRHRVGTNSYYADKLLW